MIGVKIDKLGRDLAQSSQLVWDIETDGLRTGSATVAGIGVYLPAMDRRYYINIGHMLPSDTVPKSNRDSVCQILGQWFADPANHVIAHNATYDLRCLFRIGITDIRARISDSMVWTHRADENLKRRDAEGGGSHSYHLMKAPGYGLKNLTTQFLGKIPPTLADATRGKNAVVADPAPIAAYCILDCLNTWDIFQRASRLMPPSVRKLTEEIDDPTNIVLAKMLWQGIEVDIAEALRQQARYEEAIQRCREEIWQTLRITSPLDTPDQIRHVMRLMDLKEDIAYDPFSESDSWTPSIATDVFCRLLEQVGDKSPHKTKVISLLLAKRQMEQRIQAFLRPLRQKSQGTNGRLYLDRFDSLLATTRFSCSPNAQNLPGRADKADPWEDHLPGHCLIREKTRNVIVAKPGHVLVSVDLGAAEPRYMAMLFQRALRVKNRDYLQRRRQQRLSVAAKYPVLIREKQRLQAGNPTTPYLPEWPSLQNDPLWEVFRHRQYGGDPYNALLVAMMPLQYADAVRNGEEKEWLANERWRGKKAFLAFAYGAGPATLAPQLHWSIDRTADAIANIEKNYPSLLPLRALTWLEMIHFGQVSSLWGRPRRVNGYWQLAQCKPCTVRFWRARPTFREYEARIIPLGNTNPHFEAGVATGGGSVQCFVEHCGIVREDKLETVLEADPATGRLIYAREKDPFVGAKHFNSVPFRNISFAQLRSVELDDEPGLRRSLPRQHRAARAAFNARCQMTGADHLRWLMNRAEAMVAERPDLAGCNLILTVHDSLLYEVPEPCRLVFCAAIERLVRQRPPWADLDMKADVEFGPKLGQLSELTQLQMYQGRLLDHTARTRPR